jgi:hypothetical protein
LSFIIGVVKFGTRTARSDDFLMRALTKAALIVAAVLVVTTVQGAAATRTTTFAVMRDDARIGTSTIRIEDIGPETTVATATHVAVKFAFLILYHFDQTETEQWASGQWQSISATTDDNGTVHRMNASNSHEGIIVQGNGRERWVVASVIPASLWNDAILTQNTALDPLDGRIVPVKVIARGEDGLTVQGKSIRARHYLVTTAFSQDVWYDQNHQLVRMELKGRDGSVIRYQRI